MISAVAAMRSTFKTEPGMKHLTSFAVCAVLLSILSSCARDFLQEPQESRSFVIEARTFQSTRTMIAGDQPEDGSFISIIWAADDSITVIGTGGTAAVFRNGSRESGSTGMFEGILPAGETPACAYYPCGSLEKEIQPDQVWENSRSIERNDIKYSSEPQLQQDGSYLFQFSPATSMLELKLDARGLAAVGDGELIRSVTLSVDGRSLCGMFGLDPENGTLASKSTGSVQRISLAGMPEVRTPVTAYACVAPCIRKGDRLDFTVATDRNVITLHTTSKVDFKAGSCYTLPLTLSRATAAANGLKITASADILPRITAFSFKAVDNAPYILDKELKYKDGYAYYLPGKTSVSSIDGQDLAIQGTGISACIPYLYHFSLKPQFTLSSKDTRFCVRVGGAEQVSGVSEQDFSVPVEYEVYDSKTGAGTIYTVNVTNTGLPVVVLDQHSAGAADSKGFNKFLDMVIPAKSSDFTEIEDIAIYNADGTENLSPAKCGFRLRGNFSSTFPKKSIGIKLVKKEKILGMPKNKRWCLLANYNDKTHLRNDLALEIARRVAASGDGSEGLGWQPHGEFVELVLNGRHVGNYYLCEQIKIGSNRINISDEWEDVYSEKGDAVTFDDCGYLLEFDVNLVEEPQYGTEDFYFFTKYCRANNKSKNYQLPVISHNDYDSQTNPIWLAVQDSVNALDQAVYNMGNTPEGYADVADRLDMVSAADYLLVFEFALNHELMHPKSAYTYKDGAGKFRMGPVWDFDLWTFVNVSNIGTMGGLYETYPNKIDKFTFDNSCESTEKCYFWYKYLLRNQLFVNLVKERWAAFRANPALSQASLGNYIDSRVEKIRLSMSYDEKIWPLSYTSPSSAYPNGDEWYKNSKGGRTKYTYEEAIGLMKSYIDARLNGMDAAVNALTTSTNSKR